MTFQDEEPPERFIRGLKNRILQALARHAPGARSWRVWLNRWRGVHIGKDVWIGYDAIIETWSPKLVTIRDRATVPIPRRHRAFSRAKRRPHRGRCDGRPGCDYLTNVTIGKGPSWSLGDSYKVRAGANGCARQSRPAHRHG